MDPNRAGLLVFLLIIMLLTPESSSPAQKSAFQEFLRVQKSRRDVLLNTTFEGGPGDLEGISNPILPPEIDVRARELWESQVPPENKRDEFSFYSNITGLMRGDWKRLDMELNATELPGLSDYMTRETANSTGNVMWESSVDTRNITDSEGVITLDISESRSGPVQMVEANLNIQNKLGKNGHDIPLRGIHFADTGNIVMATTSKKFAGIFSLPHLTLTEERFNQSFTPLVEEINATIAELESIYQRDINPSYSGPTGSPDSCEYIVYLQIHSSALSPEDLSIIESELRFPKGQPHEDIPKVILSSLIYSPNCGFALESRSVAGEKIERYWIRASNAAQVGTLLTLIQIWLLIRQMNDTNTPSTVSKLSFWTVGMMALVDGYLCMGYLSAAIFIESTFLPFMTVAFLSFLLVSVFGMRYLILIYRIQRPEHRAQQQQQQQQQQQTPPATETPDALPLPVTATPPTPQTNGNNAQEDDGRSDVSLLYSRFYFILLGFIFATLNASTWPKPFRQMFQRALFLLVNSYWVPQIYRNIMRGCRRAFKWEFVLGMSIIRLAPMLYLYLFQGNIIFHEVEPIWAMIIVGWVWLQVCTLASQEILGPRFFVPGNLLPPSYDYHPPLFVPDLEGGLGSGDQTTVSTDSNGGVIVVGPTDCAICMHPIDLPREAHHDYNGEGGSSGGISTSSPTALLARRNYMVTPCRHIFHTQCLESWMRFKLQCPTCRNALPPL
ncbi:hypothetical protein POJ06DRAFT_252178 [Lipomyces tetrasporus]|uniref:RING-type E3 ubiquitin transferase n=1 Tax=Lipomyces tetrasporus TaxID=54092 RepID=A0AAD7VSN8_9ASCO|nr:uncharacterized protein POJ06DRAFT_252178 [Lipomyces tetrasporus]KAJ8100256.1 hypothetical protein POJ06DRAFT_252178 [Lipomyces tetrasporus]